MSTEDDIERFKVQVKDVDSLQFLREHILPDGCAMVPEEQEDALYADVSAQFEVNRDSIFIVGSAKLGFSIKPGNRFRHFNNASDVDLVIIDQNLFETVWREVHNFRQSGEFWSKENEFAHYLVKGWMRPDMLPRAKSFAFTKSWWEYFQAITNSEKFGRVKIRGALYYNSFFFESYQRICIDQVKHELS